MAVANTEKAGFVERTTRAFRNTLQEMKKVHWPSRRNLVVYTTVVIVACLVMATVIWAADFLIGALMNLIIK